jgi:hypothetical protein
MRAVGMLTTVIGVAVVAVAVVVGVKSLPDVKRYLKIRSM